MKIDESLQLISEFLLKIKWKKQMNLVLEDLMTPKEIEEFTERIKIFDLLKSWKKQREVAKQLWISITTVNRWSRVLKYGKWEIEKII